MKFRRAAKEITRKAGNKNDDVKAELNTDSHLENN